MKNLPRCLRKILKPALPNSHDHAGTPRFRLTVLLISGVLALVAWGGPVAAEEVESTIARGGRLYDKWWAVIDTDPPEEANPAYPETGAYYGKKNADWRCKECHGWDYRGAAGVYGSGKHHTGIPGIEAASGADPKSIASTLTDDTHGFGDLLEVGDLSDLAMFVSMGQSKMDEFIDPSSNLPTGDAAQGSAYFNTVCANCHGRDGKEPEDMEPLGKLAADNPWEVLHKIMNGQPDEDMPAMRAFGSQVVADLLAHVATLPKE